MEKKMKITFYCTGAEYTGVLSEKPAIEVRKWFMSRTKKNIMFYDNDTLYMLNKKNITLLKIEEKK